MEPSPEALSRIGAINRVTRTDENNPDHTEPIAKFIDVNACAGPDAG